MNISEFLETKEIKKSELDDNFNLLEKLDINMYGVKGCPKCGDHLNQTTLRSPSWTGCVYCRACKSILYIYFSDRMGGINKDTVFVYKNK